MKKILGVSLVAVLAVLPVVSFAAPVPGNPGPSLTDADAAAVATAYTGPKYPLKEADALRDSHVATAGYVKGAYNASIKAVNKVYDVANSAVSQITALGSSINDVDGRVNDNSDAIAVLNGDENTPGSVQKQIKDAIADVDTAGVVGRVDTLEDDVDVLIETTATQDGVTETINNSTATGTIMALSDWTNESAETEVTVNSTLSGATYTEPAIGG